jgi:hypothetical protein
MRIVTTVSIAKKTTNITKKFVFSIPFVAIVLLSIGRNIT